MGRVRVILAAVLVGLIGLGWATSVHAMSSVKSGNNVTLPAGQTVDQTIFYTGQTVDIAGTVNGDVFCAGQTITVSGTVNGDVICAGQTVTVSATVNGNVRVAGQTVTVTGQVMHNLSAAGQAVTVDANSHVTNDAQLAGQTVTVNGSVGRDIATGAAALAVNGTVGRDVLADVMNLSLGNTAKIGGSIDYTSQNDLSRAGGAQVGGTVAKHQPPARQENTASTVASTLGFDLYMLAAGLLIALLAVLLFPGAIHSAAAAAFRSPLLTLAIGFVTSVVVPAIIFLLFVTVVGIPLALLLILAWILVNVAAWLLAAYYIGALILRKATRNPIWYMLLGVIVLAILSYIPFLGFLIWLLSIWLGVGMLADRVRHVPRPRYEVAPAGAV